MTGRSRCFLAISEGCGLPAPGADQGFGRYLDMHHALLHPSTPPELATYHLRAADGMEAAGSAAVRARVEERGGQDWLLGLDDGFPPKPPRMHWRTYRRLEALDEDLGGRWLVGVSGWLERRRHPVPRA